MSIAKTESKSDVGEKKTPTFKKIVRFLWQFLIPFVDLYKQNKLINKKLEILIDPKRVGKYNYEYACDDEKIEDEILVNTLKETVENKKILEDKAKSTLIAITISSTLIFSIIKFMQDSRDSVFAITVLALFSFTSLSYMVIAGILSLYSIGEINKVSTMYPEDYLKGRKDKNIQIAENIEYNYLNNLKRNNYMTISYRCIINSISILVLIFITSTIITLIGHTDELQPIKKDLATLRSDVSSVSKENTIEKQDIINIQQNLMNIDNDKGKIQDKINNISLCIKDIHNIISKNQDSFSQDIKLLLTQLEDDVNKLK